MQDNLRFLSGRSTAKLFMPYSVLQKTLETPSLEQLRAAFRGVPGLTAYDANILGRDAFGILGKGFGLEQATALKNSLAAQGVAAEVVEDAKLPALPDTFFLARVDCTAEALLLHDSLGRVAELAWKDILLIAAGVVPMSEFKDVRTETKQWVGFPQGNSHLELPENIRGLLVGDDWLSNTPLSTPGFTTRATHETKEEHHNRLLLEIILAGGTLRYSLNSGKASPLLFAGLGERRTKDLQQNFALLVQGLVAGAPQAAINRGAYYLRQNDLSFCYPGKVAFFHEIVWLLWQKSLEQSATS
jgi:hypothetical protein